MERGWNHNVEYHPLVHDVVGTAPVDVLEIGTGEGRLARELAARGHRVTAIDLDGPTLERARANPGSDDVEWIRGDALTHPFPPAAFDAVVSIATLHHVDERAGLQRMADLVRPGGAVVVVGLARAELPRDVGWELAGAVTTRAVRRRRGGFVEVDAPTVWPPPSTHREIRSLAEEVLPGSTYRRHVLWRYSVVWRRP